MSPPPTDRWRPRRCRWHQWPTWLRVSLAVVAAWCTAAGWNAHLVAADSQLPLYNQSPFDAIVLNEENGGTVYRVLPLRETNPDLDRKTRPEDVIRFRPVNDPDKLLQVRRSAIERIEFFEQRLLQEARKLIQAKKFDEAFQYLIFLHDNYPQLTETESIRRELLMAEAQELYQTGVWERSLMLWSELYDATPDRERTVLRGLARVLQRMFQRHVEQDDYESARRLYDRSLARYGSDMNPLFTRWQAALEQRSSQLLAEAREKLQSNQLRDAYLASRRVSRIWPDLEGAAELISLTATRYPLLSVGVSQTAPTNPGFRHLRYQWSGRRAIRLHHRLLMEPVGVSSEGSRYLSPVGTASISEDGLSLSFRIAEPIWQIHRFTAVDLAQLLTAATKPNDDRYRPLWRVHLRQLVVDDLANIHAELNRPHLRIESILDLPLDGTGDTSSNSTAEISSAEQIDGTSDIWSPYQLADPSESERRMVANLQYVLAQPGQIREIVEQRFPSSGQMVDALRSGRVDMVDRLFPADVWRIRDEADLEIRRYRIPSVHVLVPNTAHPFPANRGFRRAILYAIDREKILRRDLLGGQRLAGCQTLSGPFPVGFDRDDPIGYASDPQLDPRPFDPRHARTLIQLAEIELRAVAEKAKRPLPTLQEIVLAHPNGEIARVACREIVDDLALLGIVCRLRPLPDGEYYPADDDWDFLYSDYVMTEPLTDAYRLLALDGFARCPSAHLNLALRQLQQADSWTAAGQKLRTVHQLCFDDTSIVPLWQLADHFAFRKGIQGIPSDPLTTYQEIEQWKLLPIP